MSTHYPDSPPDTLGDLKSIKRIPGMAVVPKSIQWGDDYQSWPVEKRLRYAERLAATMNNAADVLQKDRNLLNEQIKEKEALLKQAAAVGASTHEMMSGQLARDNAEKQELMTRVVELTAENKALRGRLRALEG
jgi:hypothetical protein